MKEEAELEQYETFSADKVKQGGVVIHIHNKLKGKQLMKMKSYVN